VTEQERSAPEQEIRFAVVLYGGVSLAIYMYGVVEELLHLVRASAPSESTTTVDEPAGLLVTTPTGTEAVYRKLARLLPGSTAGPAPHRGPVRTRFIVDIISGISAGGINGVCLAKALVNESDLGQLKDLWVDEGDIAGLINDQGQQEDGDSPAPASLLDGHHMQDILVSAMNGMNGSREGPSRLVDDLDLWVTATDLEGLRVPISVSNASVEERRHANRYRFRYRPADGGSDFKPADNRFLAYAARSTSAFPFAFEPAFLEGFRRPDESDGDWQESKEGWKKFHSDYAAADRVFASRSFSDGGILDNKPFSYATAGLVGRQALIPVDRKLLYVEPDPVPPEADPQPTTEIKRWGPFPTAQAATLKIPRVESIRQDIEEVVARNRSIERIRDITAQIITPGDGPARPPSPDWGSRTLSAAVEDPHWGPTYGVYFRLKVRAVVDWLADLIIRARGLDPDSDLALASHQVVRAWKDATFREDAQPTLNEFLLFYDLPYRVRRIDFVLQKLKECIATDAGLARRALRAVGVEAEPSSGQVSAADIRELREALTTARDQLTAAESQLVTNGLAPLLDRIDLSRTALRGILDRNTDDEMRAQGELLVEANQAAFDDLAGLIKGQIGEASAESRSTVMTALPDADLPEATTEVDRIRVALRRYFDRYEAYDLSLFPLHFGTGLGETNPVEVIRISPLDAQGPEDQRQALMGDRVHHFGAFFDKDWRQHDMLWGRLDASECLIRVLTEESGQRDSLVAAAHAAIIEDYRSDPGIGPEKVAAWLAPDGAAADLDPEDIEPLLARSQRVVARVVEAALPEKEAAEGVRGIVSPLVDATLGDLDPKTALWRTVRATVATPKAAPSIFCWGLLLCAGIVGAIYCDGALMVIASGVVGLLAGIPLLAGFGALLLLSKARRQVREAGLRAVMEAPPTETR